MIGVFVYKIFLYNYSIFQYNSTDNTQQIRQNGDNDYAAI